MIDSEWLPARANVLRMFALAFGIGLAWLASPASAGTNAFTPVGPEGGDVKDLAWHPTDSSIVYAATAGGIYRSTDSGQHWQLVHDRMVEAPRALAVHPSQPDLVFAAGFNSRVLVSTDAGATWSALASFVAMDAPAWDIKYGTDGTLYVVSTRHIFRSTDQGASWHRGGEVSPTINMVHTLLVDNDDPRVLYVTASAEGFRSTDGGDSWEPWNMPATDVQDFAMTTESRIWAASYAGTFFSDDRGTSWTNALVGPSMAVTVAPNDPHTIYSGTFGGLQRSTDNGAHWTNIHGSAATGSSDDAGTTRSIAVDASRPNHLLISGSSGIQATKDGGTSWTASHSGIHALGASKLISAPGSDRIYVQTSFEGLFAISAADGGSVGLNNPQLRQLIGGDAAMIEARGLLVLPGSPDRLLVPVLRGVAHSIDGGTSWIVRYDPEFSNAYVGDIVATSSDNQKLLTITELDDLFESVDGGIGWTPLGSVSAYQRLALIGAPSNPRTIYMIARFDIDVPENALLRSLDGGATWSQAIVPSPWIASVAVDPTDDLTVYVGAAEGALYKSTDGGDNWTRLIVTSPYENAAITTVGLDPQNPNIVYVSGNEHIGRSVDGGLSWQTLLDDGPRVGYTNALVVDAQRPHHLYAAIAGHGVEQISIEPDIELTATSATTRMGFGASGTYSFRARNVGPFDATNVRTTVQLPTGATNVSATSTTASCSIAANVVTCVAPTLHVGSYADITITSTQSIAGKFVLAASVEGDQPDPVLANNTATIDTEVTEIADLSVTLAAPARPARGDAVTFTLSVYNAGPSAATAATVSFSLTSGLNVASVTPSANCSTAGGTVTCQLATLAVDTATTWTIVTAPTSAAGSYSGTATLTSSGTDPVASNDSATQSITVVEPVGGIIVGGGGGSGGGGSSGGGSANGGGGGGSTSPWMLLALLLLLAARPARRPQPLAQGISGSTSRASCSSDSCQPR